MLEIQELVDNLKKAGMTELKMGCKNAAVFGGFSTFAVLSLGRIRRVLAEDSSVSQMLTQADELAVKMRDYVGADKIQRIETANKLMQMLENISRRNFESKTLVAQDNEAKREIVPRRSGLASLKLKMIKNVGPKRVKLFQKLGIYTVEDLLYHFPRRYEDRSHPKPIAALIHGETQTCRGKVIQIQEIKPRGRLTITKAAFSDGESTGYAVWFNQPYVKNQITGREILFTGKVERKFGRVEISVQDFEVMNGDPIHGMRLVPVYPSTEGLNSKLLRAIMKEVLDSYESVLDEFIPNPVINKFSFLELGQALRKIHFPDKMEDVDEARRRLVFEELFILQLGVCSKRFSNEEKAGIKHKPQGPLQQRFVQNLPYQLTAAQLRVFGEIVQDMEKTKPMNRLVQGDVGSGKTIVAAAALVKTVESGHQGIMMAPTEILAGQHFAELYGLLNPLGVATALLTGSMSKHDKDKVLDDIRQGRVDIVVGTHAIIQEGVKFQDAGLVITDEQHRFGVKQRAALQGKGQAPDVLVMTATPIPRTLALTVYGELDISIIDELPPGRRKIKTYWATSQMKERIYRFIRRQVQEGYQVYYVCPLVEESDKLDVSAACDLAEFLQTEIFPDLSIGLMHGRLKQNIKDEVMREFKNGRINILVATTVIEVGVNVPNANLMIIENADRFGLAQLHQLRGRVGRSTYQAYCVLIANPSSEEGQTRMKVMEQTSDGFIIAEEDLRMRGPGEFFGTKQSGLPDLKIADLISDIKTLREATKEAMQVLSDDPLLRKPPNIRLKEKIVEKFRDSDSFFNIS